MKRFIKVKNLLFDNIILKGGKMKYEKTIIFVFAFVLFASIVAAAEYPGLSVQNGKLCFGGYCVTSFQSIPGATPETTSPPVGSSCTTYGNQRCLEDNSGFETCLGPNGLNAPPLTWTSRLCDAGKVCRPVEGQDNRIDCVTNTDTTPTDGGSGGGSSGGTTPAPVCASGERRCNGDILEKCTQQGDRWEYDRSCGSEYKCNSERKECNPCKVGTTSCTGNTLNTCSSQGVLSTNLCSNGCKTVDSTNARCTTLTTVTAEWGRTCSYMCQKQSPSMTCIAGSRAFGCADLNWWFFWESPSTCTCSY